MKHLLEMSSKYEKMSLSLFYYTLLARNKWVKKYQHLLMMQQVTSLQSHVSKEYNFSVSNYSLSKTFLGPQPSGLFYRLGSPDSRLRNHQEEKSLILAVSYVSKSYKMFARVLLNTPLNGQFIFEIFVQTKKVSIDQIHPNLTKISHHIHII